MSEKTRIVQCYAPPLLPGIYTVEVKQTITRNDGSILEDDMGKKSLSFGIDAARFTLSDTDIYSVYPPANQFGSYTGSIPHIVFTRRTLPWERTADGDLPKYMRDHTDLIQNPPMPWMALLLFEEAEMLNLKIEAKNVASLLTSENNMIVCPTLKIDASDKSLYQQIMNAGCNIIDIPKHLFTKYCPQLDALSYLAHAKQVTIEHKDKAGINDIDENGTGVFSVMVGNRVVRASEGYTAVLISLEGLTDFIPPNIGSPAKKSILYGSSIRAAVLANWSFSNTGQLSFLELIKSLEIKPLKVNKSMSNTSSKILGKYYDTGYVPMQHLMRNGASTISWYHGPFVPKLMPKSAQNISFSSADAALRYDETTGFMDVSFAAAWQLGRILALRDQSFSKAIFNWRSSQKMAESGIAIRKSIGVILNNNANISVKEKVIQYLGGTNGTVAKFQSEKPIIPQEIQEFLSKLYRLNGVPFGYLIPHELLLEKEHNAVEKAHQYSGTMACFYVDPAWIEAMLDGALSIGRVKNTDMILDQAMAGGFIKEYTSQLSANESVESDKIQLNVTGFILRSDLISGWRGIEIRAFDKDDKLLPALRFERIDSDIFLGVFNGNVNTIVITEPYEGLHFGLKQSGKEVFEKRLKNESINEDEVDFEDLNINQELKNGLIDTDGVLAIASLANLMKEKLQKKEWLLSDHFTSAEFAYQMIDSPIKQTIKITITVQK